MGTCYSKRSDCYDLNRYRHNSIKPTMPEFKTPESPPATLRRFSSLRHSMKTLTSLAHHRRSLRYKPIAVVMSPNKHRTLSGPSGSTRKRHCLIIRYNETKEALV